MSARTGTNSVDLWSNTAKDGTGTNRQPIVNDDGQFVVESRFGFSIPAYDYFSLAYDVDGNLETLVYKSGGPGGTTVATVTLAYSSGNLVSVTKS
jgi:hypothetical protein